MAQYLKQDSELGYVEDVAEIEYLKFNNLRHTILGCMLGDFDETGAYVVSPEIVEELINMKKYVADNYDNIEICRSELKLDKQITFMVTFEGNKATLSLLEKLSYEANFKINSGTYSNINEYVLDYVETSGEINRNMVYQRWNIDVFGGEVIDIFNCEDSILAKYLGVVNRFKYLLEANKKLLQKEEALEEIEAGYSNQLLTILNSYPKLKEAVLKQITDTLTEKKEMLNVNKPNFTKTFNEILENAIESNINVLNEKEKEGFAKDKRNAVVEANVKKAEVIDIEHKKENEQTPAVIKLDVPATTETKTIQELGEEFVKEHQRVVAIYQPEDSVDNTQPKSKQEPKKYNPETERNKLISTLTGAGLGFALAGAPGMVMGAVTGALVAEVVEDAKEAVKEAKKTNAPQKGASAQKPAAKKPAVKKAAKTAAAKGGSKSAEKKAQAKGSAKAGNTSGSGGSYVGVPSSNPSAEVAIDAPNDNLLRMMIDNMLRSSEKTQKITTAPSSKIRMSRKDGGVDLGLYVESKIQRMESVVVGAIINNQTQKAFIEDSQHNDTLGV